MHATAVELENKYMLQTSCSLWQFAEGQLQQNAVSHLVGL